MSTLILMVMFSPPSSIFFLFERNWFYFILFYPHHIVTQSLSDSDTESDDELPMAPGNADSFFFGKGLVHETEKRGPRKKLRTSNVPGPVSYLALGTLPDTGYKMPQEEYERLIEPCEILDPPPGAPARLVRQCKDNQKWHTRFVELVEYKRRTGTVLVPKHYPENQVSRDVVLTVGCWLLAFNHHSSLLCFAGKAVVTAVVQYPPSPLTTKWTHAWSCCFHPPNPHTNVNTAAIIFCLPATASPSPL